MKTTTDYKAMSPKRKTHNTFLLMYSHNTHLQLISANHKKIHTFFFSDQWLKIPSLIIKTLTYYHFLLKLPSFKKNKKQKVTFTLNNLNMNCGQVTTHFQASVWSISIIIIF